MGHVVAGRYLVARKRYDLALQTIRLLAERAVRGDKEDAERAVKIGVDMLEAMGFRARLRTRVVLYGRPSWLVGVSDDVRQRVTDFAKIMAATLTQIAEFMTEGAAERAAHWKWIDHELGKAEDLLAEFNRLNRDAGDQFRHGKFNVTVLDDAMADKLRSTLDLLDAAAARIQRFAPQVLYGDVFVTDRPIMREGGAQAAGVYQQISDSIALSLGAATTHDDVYVLTHEFGHRFETRYLRGEDRDEFVTLSTQGDLQPREFSLAERKHAVDEYVALWDAIRKDQDSGPVDDQASDWYAAYSNVDRPLFKTYVIPLIRKYRDDGDDTVLPNLRKELGRLDVSGPITYPTNPRPEPLWASTYGSRDWHENFAEAFAHHIMGKTLPAPLARFMTRVLG